MKKEIVYEGMKCIWVLLFTKYATLTLLMYTYKNSFSELRNISNYLLFSGMLDLKANNH